MRHSVSEKPILSILRTLEQKAGSLIAARNHRSIGLNILEVGMTSQGRSIMTDYHQLLLQGILRKKTKENQNIRSCSSRTEGHGELQSYVSVFSVVAASCSKAT